ncbi:MAG: outer membrane protein assembly factor BamA [Planctomycetes bacterium]|nr:outer membrane protein assembly factor BamA [Planctomycetota bacterium]
MMNKLVYNKIVFGCLILLCGVILYAQNPAESSKNTSAPKTDFQSPAKEAKKASVIDSIEIVGLQQVNLQNVLSKLQSKKGGAFSQAVLEEDVRRLYDSDLFIKIDWKVEDVDSGTKVKIILTVEESIMILEVKFEGVDEFSLNLLKEVLKIKDNSALNIFLAKADIKALTDKYLEKGYYFVDITYRVDTGIKGKILTYTVREGPKVKISDIVFNGNKSFPYEPPKYFWGKAYNVFYEIFYEHPLYNAIKQDNATYYQEKELVLDVERLKKFYRDNGWLDVNVFIEDVIFNAKKNRVNIAIHIDEGERYKVGKFTIADNKIINTADILTKTTVKENSIYEMEAILKDSNAIKTLYGKLGYIDCNVEIKTHFPAKTAIVDLTYEVIEGKPSYLEKIKITGNDKTKDKVIRREMAIAPGDLMDYSLIRDSLDRVGSTRYFKDMDFDIEEGSSAQLKNILLKVDETTTGMMNFGGGYSSNYGFSGIIQYDQINFDLANPPESFGGFFTGKSFAGGGQRLRLTWQPGISTSQYGLSFTEPYVFDKQLEFDFNVSGFERDWIDYSEDRDSIDFTLARRFWKTWQIGAGPRTEQIDISNVESDAPQSIQDLEGSNTQQSITYFIGNDTRNRRYFPSGGYRVHLSEEYAGGFLGGDFDFTKTILTADKYNTLFDWDGKPIVLSINSKLGQVERFGDTDVTPFFEKFYGGGFKSARGFRYRTISPKQDGVPVGGKIMGIFNSELSYPLYTEEMAGTTMEVMRFGVFYDAANVVNTWGELNWNTTRTSFGYGLRFQIGMIPISLDIAYPIKQQLDDEVQRVQMNLGFGF